jgi:hypothetical protein
VLAIYGGRTMVKRIAVLMLSVGLAGCGNRRERDANYHQEQLSDFNVGRIVLFCLAAVVLLVFVLAYIR